MSAYYNNSDYLTSNFSQPFYFDSIPNYLDTVIPFYPVIFYYPSGININISDNPYVIFSPPIQTGTIAFTLTQSGGTIVPGTTSYNSGTYTDTFVHTHLLNPTTLYNANISGVSKNGAFVFSFSFTTNSAGAGGGGGHHRG